jgi:hypothetical protein
VRFGALQSLICNAVPSLLDCLGPTATSAVSSRPLRYSRTAVPRILRDGFILSCAFAPLQSSFLSFLPAHHPQAMRHLPWDFFPHRDISAKSPLTDRISRPDLCSALSVSRALDGLLLFSPCELISSHCHVRDSLFKGFPRCLARLTHRQSVPSWRFSNVASVRVPPYVQL